MAYGGRGLLLGSLAVDQDVDQVGSHREDGDLQGNVVGEAHGVLLSSRGLIIEHVSHAKTYSP